MKKGKRLITAVVVALLMCLMQTAHPASAQDEYADLGIAEAWLADANEERLVFGVDVYNSGYIASITSNLYILAEQDLGVTGEIGLDSIFPDEQFTYEVVVPVPEEYRGEVLTFFAQLIQDDEVPELDYENNYFFIGRIEIPGEQRDQLPDLVIVEAFLVDADEDRLVFEVIVQNQGEGESTSGDIWVIADDDGDVRDQVSIGALFPGEEEAYELVVDVPTDWRDSSRSFFAEVGQRGDLEEYNYDNNFFQIGRVSIPGSPGVVQPPPPRPVDGIDPLVVVLLGAAAVLVLGGAGAATLIIRRSVKIKRRRDWEQRAKDESPPDSCQPGSHYCEVDTQLEFRRMGVTYVLLTTTDEENQRDHHHKVEGEAPYNLNQAIRVRITEEPPEHLEDRINGIAKHLAEHATGFLQHTPNAASMAAAIHMEGIEATMTYKLYRCISVGGVTTWKSIDLWKVKLVQSRDEELLAKTTVSPDMPTLRDYFMDEFKPGIQEFVDEYSVHMM